MHYATVIELTAGAPFDAVLSTCHAQPLRTEGAGIASRACVVTENNQVGLLEQVSPCAQGHCNGQQLQAFAGVRRNIHSWSRLAPALNLVVPTTLELFQQCVWDTKGGPEDFACALSG